MSKLSLEIKRVDVNQKGKLVLIKKRNTFHCCPIRRSRISIWVKENSKIPH